MKTNKNNIVFFLVTGYILIAGSWWCYLLHMKNIEVKNAEIKSIRCNLSPAEISNLDSNPDYIAILSRYRRQEWMILGEGSVFMVLLLIGLWRIFSIRQKELALAKQQQNFLLSITHELKSPIASVQLILETIQKRQLSAEQLQKLTSNGLKDNDRLHKLVYDLLLAAKVEGGYEYSFREIDLRELIQDCITLLKPKFNGKIIFEEYTPILLNKGDKDTLFSAIYNLIENAIKYSDSEKDIRIKLYEKKGQIYLEIIDQGVGIPKSEKGKIFDKFYRIGNEETRKYKGTGLGLYIVKKVVEAHGAQISVKDNLPVGTIFVLIFNN
jgi:signal transduction histidine kinase